MPDLLVRDVMTIGVPVCRDTEACSAVLGRLGSEAVIVLDEDGMACGWVTRSTLQMNPARPVGEVMDEDIPTVAPDLPAAAAAQMMRDRGVDYLFLMHSWPGEPRPSAMISRSVVERQLATVPGSS